MIERKILIGAITSIDFLKQLHRVWDPRYLESPGRELVTWCLDYYNEYFKAPGKHIETIFFEKLRVGDISQTLAEVLEQDILPGLSEEYTKEGLDVTFLWNKTMEYFQERHLTLHDQQIRNLLDAGQVDEANRLASSYTAITIEINGDLDLSNIKALLKVQNAFNEVKQPVVQYPGVLGEMWNPQFVKGGFIGLMASEKRGKSFWLLDIAMRASKQNRRVAFFQAGDMTEAQQLMRICSYRTKKVIKEQYEGDIYLPVVDCVRNQLDICDKEARECNFGVFSDRNWTEKELQRELCADDLKTALKENPDYKNCKNCKEMWNNHWGSPWFRKLKVSQLQMVEAKRSIREFFIKAGRGFKLSTHANGTLSVGIIRQTLEQWEKDSQFIPDLIVIDYADLLVTEQRMEFRHQQNQIWKDLRGLSQMKPWLVVTATQADAKSYDQDRLKLSNFSEDKRKYSHVTAMYGLNQDHTDREKRMGIMRINELVVREGDFQITNEVVVLQSLHISRAFLSSYK